VTLRKESFPRRSMIELKEVNLSAPRMKGVLVGLGVFDSYDSKLMWVGRMIPDFLVLSLEHRRSPPRCHRREIAGAKKRHPRILRPKGSCAARSSWTSFLVLLMECS